MFKQDDKVIFVYDSELIRGKISSIFEEIGVCIVRTIIDGEAKAYKVKLKDMAKDEPVSEQKDEEPVELESITLTPGDFRSACIKVMLDHKETLGSSIPEILDYSVTLHRALFIHD